MIPSFIQHLQYLFVVIDQISLIVSCLCEDAKFNYCFNWGRFLDYCTVKRCHDFPRKSSSVSEYVGCWTEVAKYFPFWFSWHSALFCLVQTSLVQTALVQTSLVQAFNESPSFPYTLIRLISILANFQGTPIGLFTNTARETLASWLCYIVRII